MDSDALFVSLTLIVLIVGIVTIVIYIRRLINAERLALIEKGASAELFNSVKKPSYVSGSLRAALLMVGAGVGLLMGYFLDSKFGMEEVAYFSMLFISGGVGLGLAYIIEEKKASQIK